MRVLISACAMAGLLAATLAAQPPAKKTGRTPWGDPDLQGNYTNLYEDGTPLERPAQFEGRSLADITSQELAKL
jgi:hypothetical protein